MLGPDGPLKRRPRRGESIDVDIEALSAEGLGVAPLELPGSASTPPRRYSLLVRGALPGERVRAEVGLRRGRRLFARARALLSASPERIAPRCPHFEDSDCELPGCGGCSLQSLPYAQQLSLKRARVVELLGQVGFDSSVVAEVVGQDQPWYYRNKMEYTFHPPRVGPTVLGLHPAGSHDVLPLGECHLLSPFSSRLLPLVGQWAVERGLSAYWPRRDSGFLRTLTIREGKRTGERLVELTTSADETVTTRTGPCPAAEIAEDFRGRLLGWAEELSGEISSICWTQQLAARGSPTRFVSKTLHGNALLNEILRIPRGDCPQGDARGAHELRFEIHPRAFFQPATLQAERLYAEVLQAAGLDGETGPVDAVDLYCGTGTIALCLAPYCRQVTGIELHPDAADNARRNALFNGIDNARFVAGDVGQILSTGELAAELRAVELVVVDPPRSGLAPTALAQIHAIGARRLVYVSCSPEALARDLLELARVGYQLRSVQPVDMFPQTGHIECVARLERLARSRPVG